MITIVTGAINSGKSSWMLRDASKYEDVDGFICVKTFVGDTHTGYDLCRPAQKESVAFIRKPAFLPSDWAEAERFEDIYSFSAQGFSFAASIASSVLKNPAETRFYLDEIGFLELADRGFAPQLNALLEANVCLVVAVRDFLLEQVIEKFSIGQHRLVRL